MKEIYFHEIAVYRVPIYDKKDQNVFKKFLLLFEKLLIFFKNVLILGGFI